MKLKRFAPAIFIALLVASSICFPVQANGGSEVTIEIAVTVLPPVQPPAGGGEPPVHDVDVDAFDIEDGDALISSNGTIQRTVGATSPDGVLSVTIPEGTVALEKDGTRLKSFTVAVDESPPDPPEDAHIIGMTYHFGPDGATFYPPLTLTWDYDPDTLGDVAEEDLVVAYYDEESKEWIELECEVDTENNIITAIVPHFSKFAVIGRVLRLEPAAIKPISLTVSPRTVYTGEPVNIKVVVSNTGGESGTCTITLKIDGEVKETKTVTVAAGLSKEIFFTISTEKTGVYLVSANGLPGTFTVEEKPAVVFPANFVFVDLTISPGEVYPDELVTIGVTVFNSGGESGLCDINLKINGVVKEAKQVSVDAGSSKAVTFSLSRGNVGTYTIEVNGLSGSFTVIEKPVVPRGTNWPLIVGIVLGVIIIGLLGFYLWSRRRGRKSL